MLDLEKKNTCFFFLIFIKKMLSMNINTNSKQINN